MGWLVGCFVGLDLKVEILNCMGIFLFFIHKIHGIELELMRVCVSKILMLHLHFFRKNEMLVVSNPEI